MADPGWHTGPGAVNGRIVLPILGRIFPDQLPESTRVIQVTQMAEFMHQQIFRLFGW